MRGPASGGWGIATLFLCLSAVLFALYIHHEPVDGRSNDLGSHLHYVALVQEGDWVPRSEACWECHQPPVYYALAALLLDAADEPPPFVPRKARIPPGAGRLLRVMAACLAVGTVGCWLLTIRLMLRGTYERIMASALATFWPAVTIDAVKVNNDGLLYLLAAASLWQLVRWRCSRSPSALALGVALAGASALAKSNGVVVTAIAVASVLVAAWRRPPGVALLPRGAVPGIAMLGLFGAGWLGLALWRHGSVAPRVETLEAHLHLDNRISNFFFWHLDDFRNDPWARAAGGSGRDEYWNYLFRTSLYGEFISRKFLTRQIAYALAALGALFGLASITGMGRWLVRDRQRMRRGATELLLTVAAFLSFSIALRVAYPFAPHGDFRFVFPIVIAFAIPCAETLGRIRRRLARLSGALSAFPALLVVSFCAGSTWLLLMWP